MTSSVALLIALSGPSPLIGQVVGCSAAPAGSTVAAICAADVARFATMVRGDAAALDSLLGDELTYAHADGTRDTKSQFLARLRSGKLKYEGIAPRDREVHVYDEMAVVTGRSAMRVRAEGTKVMLDIRFLEVYIRRAGRWLLVAWQSTRLAEP